MSYDKVGESNVLSGKCLPDKYLVNGPLIYCVCRTIRYKIKKSYTPNNVHTNIFGERVIQKNTPDWLYSTCRMSKCPNRVLYRTYVYRTKL